MKKTIKKYFNQEKLSQSKYLKAFQKHLKKKHLWSTQPKYIARGTSIGVFWSLVLPIAQIPASVAFCIMLQGNLIAAAIATLPANPFTYPFLLYGYYQVGQWVSHHLNITTESYTAFITIGGIVFVVLLVPLTYCVGYYMGQKITRRQQASSTLD